MDRYIEMLIEYCNDYECDAEKAFNYYYELAVSRSDLYTMEALEENKEDIIYLTSEKLNGL